MASSLIRVLDAVSCPVGELVGDGLREMPVAVLQDNARTLASWLASGEGRFMAVVAELDVRGDDVAAAGFRDLAHWLMANCGLASVTARERVRVARAFRSLPLTMAALCSGSMSYAKARAICRCGTPGSEGDLVELAASLTAAQLERACRAMTRICDDKAKEWEEKRKLVEDTDWDGTVRMEVVAPPDDGAILTKALGLARSRLWRKGDPHPSGLDALVEICRVFVEVPEPKHPATPMGATANVYQVVVHVPHTLFAPGPRRAGEGPALVEGHGLPDAIARRITCDASLAVSADGPDGGSWSIGRRSRVVPWPIRVALMHRDGGCAFPGCPATRHVDAHHIVHWADGGETSMDNLVMLCRRHHRLVHHSGWLVRIDPATNRAVFTTPSGQDLDIPNLPNVEGLPPWPMAEHKTGTGERLTAFGLDVIIENHMHNIREERRALADAAASPGPPAS